VKRIALIFALVGASLGLRAAEKVVGGPFVVHVTQKSATVVWVVETEEATGPVLRARKKQYTGLEPGATHEYDVFGGDEGRVSFKTAPVAPADFHFVVYGDTRTRHDMHRRVVAAVVKHGIPDFVLHTGDLVANGTDSAQWPVFFEIEHDLLRRTAFFPALGNHERNSRDFYDFFNVTTPYYSFDWGQAHFIVLNSDIGNAAASKEAKGSFWKKQVRWLEEDLAKSQSADFRFLTAHHPPITAVARRQGGNPEMAALVPLFEKMHLTAGFFGHDHNYQHYLKNGVHYVTTGGGGAPLYDVDKPPPGITQKVISTEHFVSVTVAGKSAHIEAFALDGSVLDRIDLKP
jgi:calcineurin-like phosphoesterase family protein